jgi:hypothetical protein
MAIHQCVFIHSPDLRPSTYTTMLKTLRLSCCPLVDTFVLGVVYIPLPRGGGH